MNYITPNFLFNELALRKISLIHQDASTVTSDLVALIGV